MKKYFMIFILMLVFIPAKSQNISGLYSVKTKYFCYGLQINSDSTFVFSELFSGRLTACEGKWRIYEGWKLILECEEETFTSRIAFNYVDYMCERIWFIEIVNHKELRFGRLSLKKVKKCDCLYSRKKGKIDNDVSND